MPLATTTGRLTHALSLALLLALFAAGTAQAQWINEVHYDNTGTDEGEAVEVVLPSSADPAAFDLYLYNGNGGAAYVGPLNLATFTAGGTGVGFTVYSAAIAGIQNGSPDGLALTENGTLIPGQFLSYEGSFAATDGPAVGVTSADIGVAEGSEPPGQSLQLTGTGTIYEDFTWAGPADDSFGNVNADQMFGGPSPTPVVTFTAAGGSVAEGDDATLTITLDFPNDMPDGNPVTVTVLFDEDASTASASDFSGPTPVQVTFDGTTDNEQQSVIVSATPDEAIEGDETAVFDLFIAGGIAELGTPATFSLAIEDGDAPEPARVQVIHNAPDPELDLVDVSIVDVGAGGDGVAFDDVPFRAATPFFDLAPGTYTVLVTDEEDPGVVVIDETVTVLSGETYQLIASGVADPSLFEPNPSGQPIAATLFIDTEAREASSIPGVVQIKGVHGSPDTPAVDVREVSTNIAIVNDGVYGLVGDYVSVPPGAFVLEITSADGSTVFGTVYADVRGLGGEAATVLASGFLTPENDQNGPMVGVLAVLPDGTSFLLPYVVDIAEARAFPNGTPVLIEGVVTRALGAFTRMQDETGGITIRQTSGAFFDDVADGTIAPGTELQVVGETSEFNQLKQINGSGLQDYAVLGTTDVPTPQLVTLDEIASNGEAYESELIQVVNLIIEPDGDFDFQAATTYAIADPTLDDGSVSLRVPNADDTAIDATPIPTTLAIFTGVLGQFDNADPAAGYQLTPIQEDDIVAADLFSVPLQIIHNAPDPALAVVDIYGDGELFIDDLAFRTATPFDGVPADIEIEIAVAPGDSDSVDDAFFTATYTLDSNASGYQLIATGVGEGSFEPNPDGEDIAFTLLVNDDALLDSPTDDTVSDLNFVHGTPDAPTIDVRTGATQDIILFNDVAYGDITGYQPIAGDQVELHVTTADGTEFIDAFLLDLSERVDEAGTILASGFLTPDNEPGDAPRFALLVVFADGSVEVLWSLIAEDTEDGTAAPTTFSVDGTYPNPFATTTTLRYDLPADALVSVEVYDVLGRRVAEVAPEAVPAGSGRTVELDAALPSGTYVYRVTAEMPTETRTETGRMTVVR